MLLTASATLTSFSVNNFYLEKAENEEMRRIEQACPIRRATAGVGRRWAHIEKQPHDDENHAVAYSIASLYMLYTPTAGCTSHAARCCGVVWGRGLFVAAVGPRGGVPRGEASARVGLLAVGNLRAIALLVVCAHVFATRCGGNHKGAFGEEMEASGMGCDILFAHDFVCVKGVT